MTCRKTFPFASDSKKVNCNISCDLSEEFGMLNRANTIRVL